VRSSSVVAACVASALAVGIGAPPARADDEDGRTLFAAGRELRSQGKCEAAIVQFRRALEAYPEGLGSLRNIAECEEQLGLYAAARRDWWDLRRAVLQTTQPRYQGWDKDAEGAYAKLASKVAHVTVKLEGATPDRVRVVIDGKPLDPRLVGVELERDLGAHTAEAFYGGAAPVSEKFTLGAGDHQVVPLAIPANAPGEAPISTGAPSTAPREAPSSSAGLRSAGFVTHGVGALGVAGLIASIAIRQSALGTIDAQCPSHANCSSSLQGDRDRGATASMLVNVFGAVAIVGVGVGVTLLAVSTSKSSKSAGVGRPAALTLAPTSGGAQLGLRGMF
jgi:hypothetical protein